MVKIQDQISLKGEETITITEFRMAPGEVLRQVEMGKTFNISKQGKVVAVIHKPEPTAFELGAAARALERKVSHPASPIPQTPSVSERTLPEPVLAGPKPATLNDPPAQPVQSQVKRPWEPKKA